MIETSATGLKPGIDARPNERPRMDRLPGARFRRLLVPISGNAASSIAIAFALRIAKAAGGELTFCYVLDMSMLGMGSSAGIDPGWIDSLRPVAEKVGRAALSRATAAGVPAKLQLVEGMAEDVIASLAPSFDLVVMGTRALRGLTHLLEHSVTDAVVRASSRPVLVVRESETPAARDSEAVFERLIVPIDSSAPSEAAIALASALAAERTGAIVFVHAVDVARAIAFSGTYALDDGGAFEIMRRFGKKLLSDAEAQARSAGVTDVAGLFIEGAALGAVLGAITANDADAVVIGTHGRHGFDRAFHGSFTEDLVCRSPVPVLTLHLVDSAGT